MLMTGLTIGKLNIIYRPMVKEATEEARLRGIKFSPIQFERKRATDKKRQLRLFH